tara:strand:- start:47 stop:583 length:537 start_codon:yes stop_codon:yes gene_type:complete
MAIKWPIYRAGDTGLGLLESYEQIAVQNLIVLLLTNPGERTMDIDFGVGIRHVLFENINEGIENSIRSEIYRQVAIYLPYISISEVLFASSRTDPDISLDENYLGIQIKYSIPALNSAPSSIGLSVSSGGEFMIDTGLGYTDPNIDSAFTLDGARFSGGSAGLLEVGHSIPGYGYESD